ncbi:hypothetical protein VC83_03170 [Pseudogymnoascus destructans]|uniref:Uncharacterized protein n=2 Tax=Pseudogymnoascus destructans TaxID=655981 RepID=L8G9R5_PSED2|nr:uncharacterized protein VC83_03170 [Pseudogymnoascus destructans]ELR09398.1 hypothetical protein GMDG_03962 [Pseudogymnoascus destructans 20631-21]OAF60235.1 hypothetical protein VC83_03170 [Pseudogymnoascus destructans]
MAPIDAAKVQEQAPPLGDSKTDSTRLENVESGVELDRSVLGYASLFGLQKDTGLKGSKYSMYAGSPSPQP